MSKNEFELDSEKRRDPDDYDPSYLGEPEQAFRKMNTNLGFYRACSQKCCRRAQACSGDGKACFRQWWRHVHPQVKALINAMCAAVHQGVPIQEARRRGNAAAVEWDRRFMAGEFSEEARAFLAGPLANLPLIG
jgi:hypothetical protein